MGGFPDYVQKNLPNFATCSFLTGSGLQACPHPLITILYGFTLCGLGGGEGVIGDISITNEASVNFGGTYRFVLQKG